MINHNIPSMDLAASNHGEIALPSEDGKITFGGNLRQFLVLTRRAFNENAIVDFADKEEIKHTVHDNQLELASPYFGLTLKFQPLEKNIDDFVAAVGDEFFEFILNTVNTSQVRKFRGQRAVFMSSFNVSEDDKLGLVLESKIIVSTSVFFNDYRVTTSFPGTETELELVVEQIFNKIKDVWGNEIKFELVPVVNPYFE